MVLVFDLDDTLYAERSFVESGFRSVAAMLEVSQGWERNSLFSQMMDILSREGRGAVFDELLKGKQRFSRDLVQRCLQAYRQHEPSITLFREAQQFLDASRNRRMYLVTDGNKSVQSKKVSALGIEKYFKKIFITHRYGLRHAKPSVYCFDLIRKMEQCDWSDMAYIGDNPAKDFVNLNPLGVTTIRIDTGEYRAVVAKPGYDAKIHIPGIHALSSVLNGIKE
jgi:putative hydrolase of the HAD superfamily